MNPNQRPKRDQTAIEKARNLGVFRPKDLIAAGYSRSRVYQMQKSGRLQRTGHGLYTLVDLETSTNLSLAEVACKVPHGIVCLNSALRFHGLTTQLPFSVWLTIPRGSWRPKLDFIQLELTYGSSASLTFGIEEHLVDGVTVQVYSIAKTIADCFKYRNKVGLDVALEALRSAWSERRVAMAELIEAAEICRVSKIMRPYLETLQ